MRVELRPDGKSVEIQLWKNDRIGIISREDALNLAGWIIELCGDPHGDRLHECRQKLAAAEARIQSVIEAHCHLGELAVKVAWSAHSPQLENELCGARALLKKRLRDLRDADHEALNAALEGRTVEVLDAATRIVAGEDAEPHDHDLLTEAEGDALERLIAAYHAALEQAEWEHDTCNEEVKRLRGRLAAAEARERELRDLAIALNAENPPIDGCRCEACEARRRMLELIEADWPAHEALDAALEAHGIKLLESLKVALDGKHEGEFPAMDTSLGETFYSVLGAHDGLVDAALEQARAEERERWRPLLERLLRVFQGDWPTITVGIKEHGVFGHDDWTDWRELPVDDEARDAVMAARKAIREADEEASCA